MFHRDLRPTEWYLQHTTVPLTGEAGTAEAIFTALFADRPESFWLDSAYEAYGMGRFSILGALDGPSDHRICYSARARTIRLNGPLGPLIAEETDLWDWVADRMDANPVGPNPDRIPFSGGYVGYIGYGVKRIGSEDAVDPSGRDSELLHVSRYVVVDHEVGIAHAVAVGPKDHASSDAEWVSLTADQIRSATTPTGIGEPRPHGNAYASVSADHYLADIDTVHEWLIHGDSYEACYTYSLQLQVDEPPFDVYRRLRRNNPAPYGAYLRLGDRHVLSCSPERYLKVDQYGWAETKPIKGTARRSPDRTADEMAARQLANDPKSRSENLMIVDLLRNDLGLICSPGTVSVPRLMEVESYATVHQLVTTVRGRLLPRPAVAVHAAAALFPGGSMTGAPKVRTVEKLDKLETSPRGVYAGTIGYFSRCGAADLSIVIRTAVIDDTIATIGTGGAITIKSDPFAERDETIIKTKVILEAFGYHHPFTTEA